MTAESRPKCPVGRLPVSVSKIPGGGNLRRVKPINRNLVTTARQQACGVPLSAKNGTFSRRRSFRLFPSLHSRNQPLLPADTTFSEGGGGFSNYQRHRYYPSTDAPPFSLLEKRSLLLLFLPSKEELTPLSLSVSPRPGTVSTKPFAH